jgi:hypothetical protein
MSGEHLPPGWDWWDRDRCIDFLSMTHTRAGLIASILSYSGVDIDDRQITRDEVLTTNDLAAIYLALEGHV